MVDRVAKGTFICGSILWIALRFGVCRLHACGGGRFPSLWIAGGEEMVAKLGLGFICVYVVGGRVGSNSMVMAWDGYGGLGNSGFRDLLIQGRYGAKRVRIGFADWGCLATNVLVSGQREVRGRGI